jgi:hypothetical protein
MTEPFKTYFLLVCFFISISDVNAQCNLLEPSTCVPNVIKDSVEDSFYCNKLINCDPNQFNINQAILAARQSGIIHNREECFQFTESLIEETRTSYGNSIPFFEQFAARGRSQGGDACTHQFPDRQQAEAQRQQQMEIQRRQQAEAQRQQQMEIQRRQQAEAQRQQQMEIQRRQQAEAQREQERDRQRRAPRQEQQQSNQIVTCRIYMNYTYYYCSIDQRQRLGTTGCFCNTDVGPVEGQVMFY